MEPRISCEQSLLNSKWMKGTTYRLYQFQFQWEIPEKRPMRPHHHSNLPRQEQCSMGSEHGRIYCYGSQLSIHPISIRKESPKGCLGFACHHGLRNISFDKRNCSERNKNLHERGIDLGIIIEICNQTDGSLSTRNLEAVFEADREAMKRPSELPTFS